MIYLIIFALMIIIISIFSNVYERFSNNLTFSNTDKWGNREKKILSKITPLGEKLLSELPRISFPESLSTEGKLEILEIHNKQKAVSESRLNDINDEIYLSNMLEKYGVSDDEAYVINELLHDEVDPIIMNLKREYNRVRPYRLDKSITPSIDPPKHPSYPSGHSIQSYLIGLLLSEKYPGKKTYYMSMAREIAINREYAGVHYESDTLYGKIVANRLFQYFSNENNKLLTLGD
jgi:hypothetical protein